MITPEERMFLASPEENAQKSASFILGSLENYCAKFN
jgi:hypothetical protein